MIRSAHAGGVLALDLDPAERRYLLAGGADATLAIYDTQQPSGDAATPADTAREAAGTAAALTSNAAYLRDSAQVAAARRGNTHTEHAALAVVGKQAPQAHCFSVSSVAWYPVDTGLFVSGAPRWRGGAPAATGA